MLDRNLRRAATRRSAKSGLPYNPRNPYDTPFAPDVTPDNTSVQSEESEQASLGPTIGQHLHAGLSARPSNVPASIISDVEDNQSIGSDLIQHHQSMPPPSIPPRSASSSRRRHRSQLSTEDIEAQAHVERMESMRVRIEALKRAKAEAELEKEERELRREVEELGAWKDQIGER